MSDESYFVIRCTPDGLTFDEMSAAKLEKRLAEYEDNFEGGVTFAKKVPGVDGFCLNLADDELLIIKGRIVQPSKTEVVTKWSAP